MREMFVDIERRPKVRAVAPRPADQEALPYRRVQSVSSDAEMAAMLHVYLACGGLAAANELLASFKRRGGPDLATLANWIVAREVISFSWQGRTWLPQFQFGPHDMAPRRELGPVLAELHATCDENEMARWFARPNGSLGGRAPVQEIWSDFAAVLNAARVQRFAADR